jgi:hypothetical protein
VPRSTYSALLRAFSFLATVFIKETTARSSPGWGWELILIVCCSLKREMTPLWYCFTVASPIVSTAVVPFFFFFARPMTRSRRNLLSFAAGVGMSEEVQQQGERPTSDRVSIGIMSFGTELDELVTSCLVGLGSIQRLSRAGLRESEEPRLFVFLSGCRFQVVATVSRLRGRRQSHAAFLLLARRCFGHRCFCSLECTMNEGMNKRKDEGRATGKEARENKLFCH